MKTILQQISRYIKAISAKKGSSVNQGDRVLSSKFQPVPSYWALIPVKVQSTQIPKKNGQGMPGGKF